MVLYKKVNIEGLTLFFVRPGLQAIRPLSCFMDFPAPPICSGI